MHIYLIVILGFLLVSVIGSTALFRTRSKKKPPLPRPSPSGPTTTKDRVSPGEVTPSEVEVIEEPVVEVSLRDRLSKTRGLFSTYVTTLLSRNSITPEAWEEIEEALIRADVGISLTTEILQDLKKKVKSQGITSPEALVEALKLDLVNNLLEIDRSLRLSEQKPNVWLFVGVNGVGKTTSIAKIAQMQKDEGKKVILAAGDTFRAAASEQLSLWAKRVGVELVSSTEGADPSSVIFDAVQKAAARQADLVLADTAGRLHTKVNLMEELKKIHRVAQRPPGQVSEVLLVIDATTGQNALVQARQFGQAVGVTGVVLTKLDGTSKGGIVLAVEKELGVPVKLVGLGEGARDLIPFDPKTFIEALFD